MFFLREAVRIGGLLPAIVGLNGCGQSGLSDSNATAQIQTYFNSNDCLKLLAASDIVVVDKQISEKTAIVKFQMTFSKDAFVHLHQVGDPCSETFAVGAYNGYARAVKHGPMTGNFKFELWNSGWRRTDSPAGD